MIRFSICVNPNYPRNPRFNLRFNLRQSELSA